MNNKRTSKWVAVIATFIVAFLLFHFIEANDIGEETGGTLTGPFLRSGHLGSLALVTSSIAIFKFQRLAFWMALAGMLLALPWFSWELFPAFWCSNENCSPGGSQYAWFDFEPEVFWLLGLFALTLFLQRRAFTK